MKLEVRYLTEFGSDRKIMTLNELTRFIHNHHVIGLYEIKEDDLQSLDLDSEDVIL